MTNTSKPAKPLDLAQFKYADTGISADVIRRDRAALLSECKHLQEYAIRADLDRARQREEIKVLREALGVAAGALDAGLNCGDAYASINDMDAALMQAREALKVSE